MVDKTMKKSTKELLIWLVSKFQKKRKKKRKKK